MRYTLKLAQWVRTLIYLCIYGNARVNTHLRRAPKEVKLQQPRLQRPLAGLISREHVQQERRALLQQKQC